MPSHMDPPGSDDLPSMSDQLSLAGSFKPIPVDSRPPGASKPHSDLDTAITTLSSSLSHNPETATCDDVFKAPSSSSCEVSVSAGTEKCYPTRTNRDPPIYLRDYELK